MPQHQVLITDHPWPGIDIEQRLLAPYGVEIIDAPDESEATLARLAQNVDAIATCWAKVTTKVVQAAQNCRIICRMGIGLDNIDIPTATSKGIVVTNTPDYCVGEVADHALGLLLAVTRNIGFFHHRTKGGEYNLRAAGTMHRMQGRTLGLFGFGKTGQLVYQRARACGMNVIACTPSGNDYGTGCKMVSFEELLEQSHYLSLHAPLTSENRHAFNADAFGKMKDGVVLVNTSRGPLVDHTALYDAIQSGKVAGAGLDVFEPEPPDLSDPLYRDERVIATPHAAFVSEESLIEMRERVAHQIAAVLSGERPDNVVNPKVLAGI
ncbi:C-terminal binding protein [Planctomicrobium sp. SH661]|uniref:C-terminal binding protein n=1 Tax=Planctomicrobium sp. SH661 TaxID=3448124 RepID=UPI003F5B80CE